MFLNFYLSIAMILIPMHAAHFDPRVRSAPRVQEEIVRLLREVDKQNEEKFFANIYEKSTTSAADHAANLKELKVMLTKLLNRVQVMEKNKKRNDFPDGVSPDFSSSQTPPGTSTKSLGLIRNKKKSSRHEKRDKWDEWTNWSACSVSCGKGRKIRWRHCQEQCTDAETEMEEKACQLPACSPGKLFGVIPI